MKILKIFKYFNLDEEEAHDISVCIFFAIIYPTILIVIFKTFNLFNLSIGDYIICYILGGLLWYFCFVWLVVLICTFKINPFITERSFKIFQWLGHFAAVFFFCLVVNGGKIN